MPDPEEPESDPESLSTSPEGTPVQHCPWCGESIGSFWGRRGSDGSHWCEACQAFFVVSRG